MTKNRFMNAAAAPRRPAAWFNNLMGLIHMPSALLALRLRNRLGCQKKAAISHRGQWAVLILLFAADVFGVPPHDAEDRSTFARFVPERSDDFAWENDMIAFRAYGPALRAGSEDSGFDAWLKRVPYPILDRWYEKNARGVSYHEDHGEGYDPYKVGSSRGAGGLALWVAGKMVTSDTFLAHRIIEQTREKTVFELDYEYPAAAGEPLVKETKRITIRLGEPFFRSDSTFSRDGKPVAGLPVVVGLTTHEGKAKVTFDHEKRWMSCWEVLDGDGLGTGVVLGQGFAADLKEIAATSPDTGHAAMITRTDPNGVVTYWAGYGWEKAGHYMTAAAWEKALEEKTK